MSTSRWLAAIPISHNR